MSRYIGVVGMSVGVAVCMCASSPWSKYSFMMIGFIYDDEAARLLVILFILVMIMFIGD